MGFMAHWYATLTQNPADAVWGLFGFLGQAVFGVRFLIQWIRSEQQGHSVIPLTFWYCSLVGAMISVTYAIHMRAWPLVMGTGMPLPIYARNIWMIYRDRRIAAAG